MSDDLSEEEVAPPVQSMLQQDSKEDEISTYTDADTENKVDVNVNTSPDTDTALPKTSILYPSGFSSSFSEPVPTDFNIRNNSSDLNHNSSVILHEHKSDDENKDIGNDENSNENKEENNANTNENKEEYNANTNENKEENDSNDDQSSGESIDNETVKPFFSQTNEKYFTDTMVDAFQDKLEVEIADRIKDWDSIDFNADEVSRFIKDIMNLAQDTLEALQNKKYKYITNVWVFDMKTVYRRRQWFLWEKEFDQKITVRIETKNIHVVLIAYCLYFG